MGGAKWEDRRWGLLDSWADGQKGSAGTINSHALLKKRERERERERERQSLLLWIWRQKGYYY